MVTHSKRSVLLLLFAGWTILNTQSIASDRLAEVARATERLKAMLAELDAIPDRHDTGIAASDNFTVIAPRGGYLAREVLAVAERLRREVAPGLPAGQEFTHIMVALSDERESATTWLCGEGRGLPGDHRIRLIGRRDRLDDLLVGEIEMIVGEKNYVLLQR